MTFVAFVALCYVLYRLHLTDYVILFSLFILLLGIFSISDVEVTRENIRIRKNYFWGMVGLRWSIDFDNVTSLYTKEYDIETNEEAFMFAENFFSFLALNYWRPSIQWLTTSLSYLDHGIEKDIEFKVSQADYRLIDRRVTHRAQQRMYRSSFKE